MKKIVDIKGMSCGHCVGRVEKALSTLAGVRIKVNLRKNQAVIVGKNLPDDTVLKDIIEEAGYEVAAITQK